MRPVKCDAHGVLYERVMNGIFEGSINIAIILENSNRFDEDLEFDNLLKRMWLGELIEEDIKLLNTRVVGSNGILLPNNSSDVGTCYACPMSKECNAISEGFFKNIFRVDCFHVWRVMNFHPITPL